MPTLVIAGEEDALTPPPEMQEMAAAIPGAQFVSIPEAGHMAPLEAPSEVDLVIQRFLEAPAG